MGVPAGNGRNRRFRLSFDWELTIRDAEKASFLDNFLKKQGGPVIVLLKEGPRDWLLIGVVIALAIAANLPDKYSEMLAIDRVYLLGGLLGVVAISLVRYLRFTLLLVIVSLAIGANLPGDLAKEFGVDPQIMLFGLIAMVLVSLANKYLKLPTGLDKSGRSKSAHGAAALFNAILKGRTAVVQTLMDQGVNVNVRTVSGKTPLMAAAYKGYGDIVTMLLTGGADANIRDSKGDTALKIAARAGFSRVVEQLKKSGAAE